jgi:hypothetical protein
MQSSPFGDTSVTRKTGESSLCLCLAVSQSVGFRGAAVLAGLDRRCPLLQFIDARTCSRCHGNPPVDVVHVVQKLTIQRFRLFSSFLVAGTVVRTAKSCDKGEYLKYSTYDIFVNCQICYTVNELTYLAKPTGEPGE